MKRKFKKEEKYILREGGMRESKWKSRSVTCIPVKLHQIMKIIISHRMLLLSY